MGRIRDLFGGGNDRPAPEEIAHWDSEDIAEVNKQWLSANPRQAAKEDAPGPSTLTEGTLEKQPSTGSSRAEFPWLHDPDKGVQWDFDPVRLRELAQPNTWVGTLVNTIVKEIAQTPWQIVEHDGTRAETSKRLRTHPEQRDSIEKQATGPVAQRLARLIDDPHPDADSQDLFQMLMADLLEVGSLTAPLAFDSDDYVDDQLVANPDPPLAIQPSAPEVWTKEFADKTDVLQTYWQFERVSSPGGTSGNTRGRRQQPIAFDRREVIWSDLNSRTNRRYGLPPTLLVRKFLESADLAITQEQNYLSKGSIPSGALVFEGWGREELEAWMTQQQENIKGKPHKWLTLAGKGGDISFEPFSYNFSEMQFMERLRFYAKVIASAFQVPTAVVGLEPEKVNYNTFEGERQNFEANTLGPYLQKLERVVNDQLVWEFFSDDLRFEFAPGMSEQTRNMISQRVTAEVSAGIRTPNEAREEIGLPELDSDDADSLGAGGDDDGDGDMGALGDLVASVADNSAGATDTSATKAAFTVGDAVTYRWQGERYHGRIGGPPRDSIQPPGMPSPVSGDNGEPVYPIHQWDGDEGAYLALNGEPNTAKPESALSASTEPLPPLSEARILDVDVPQASKAEYDVADETIDITPPEYMVAAAEAGAEAENDPDVSGDCGTGVGDRRADQITNDEVGPEVVREIASYLTSHEEDVTAEGAPGEWTDEEMSDCGNRQYAKWGGTGDGRAKAWAQGKVNELDRANGDDLTYPEANAAGGIQKDEPLRNNPDTAATFALQPSMVEDLADELDDPVAQFFDAVLSSEELADAIDTFASAADSAEKSLSEATGETDDAHLRRTASAAVAKRGLNDIRRVVEDLAADFDLAETVRDAVTTAAGQAAREAVEDAVGEVEADVAADPIVEAVQSRDRAVLDNYTDEMAEQILDTVQEGWEAGKTSTDIRDDLQATKEDFSEWGAERVARQELQIATGQARNEFAAEAGKVEVWRDSGDDRVREAHQQMDGLWKEPQEEFVVDYGDRGVEKENVPGQSEPGIGCRCWVELVDREDVDDADHAGTLT
jgi:phage portal protein BeeE